MLAAADLDTMRANRKVEGVGGELEIPADRVVVEVRGEARVLLHGVVEAVVAQVDLADIHREVAGGDDDEQHHEAAERRAPAAQPGSVHHCDCAPSITSVTSFRSASRRPLISLGSSYSPSAVSPFR